MTPFEVEFIPCFRIAFLGKVSYEGETRSDLLKRKYVDVFIKPWTLVGIVISGACAEGGPSTSGSGRTHREMSELITLDNLVSFGYHKKIEDLRILASLNPYTFHNILSISETSCISNHNRQSTDIKRKLENIARSSRNGCNNRSFAFS